MSERPWSEDESDYGRRMYATGSSLRDIAERLGRSYSSVKSRAKRSRNGSKPWTPPAVQWCMPDESVGQSAKRNPEDTFARNRSVPSTAPYAAQGPIHATVPPRDDVRRLVDLCRTRGRSLRDVCDALDLSPRAAERLLEQARSAGYTVDVAGDAVAWRKPDAEPAVIAASATIKQCTGSRYKLGVCSDLHFGSKYTMREQLADYARAAYAQGVRVFVVAGDILDGCYRHGLWELSHHGWDEQARDAFESLPQLDGAVWYVIDGNHDGTFWDQTGAVSGERLQDYFAARGRTDLIYIGHREGNLTIRMAGVARPIAVQLWHPKPGKAYALSYQLQKRIEAYAPGTKPDVLIAGHWHTCVYLESRGIHALAAGCFQSPESAFARSLAGGVSLGGWVLSWECTPAGTMRRVAAERSAYYVREESRAIELERSA